MTSRAVQRFAVATWIWLGAASVCNASSWYDTAGKLAEGAALAQVGNTKLAGGQNQCYAEEAAELQEGESKIVAEFDRFGGGDVVQMCIDASHINDIVENATGWREIYFIVAGLAALIISLFITKGLASLFKVEVAWLLYLPILGCLWLFCILCDLVQMAKKNKVALAAGLALSGTGAVTLIDPLRHSIVSTIISIFTSLASLYASLVMYVASAFGLAVLVVLFHKPIGKFLIRNLIGIVAIPFCCAIIFVLLLAMVGPFIESRAEKLDAALTKEGSIDFAIFPKKIKKVATEMARASDDVYNGRLPEGAKPFNGFLTHPSISSIPGHSWNASNGLFETKSGLVAQIYTRDTSLFKDEMVVVFRGTWSWEDIKEDYKQLFMKVDPQQYMEAAKLVQAVGQSTTLPLVVLGHSLGGGQAQFAVGMNQERERMRGVGFNQAGLSPASLQKIEERRYEGDSLRAAQATALIRLETDPVSTAGTMLGCLITVPSGGITGPKAHSIVTLIEAMDKAAN